MCVAECVCVIVRPSAAPCVLGESIAYWMDSVHQECVNRDCSLRLTQDSLPDNTRCLFLDSIRSSSDVFDGGVKGHTGHRSFS